jgi:hypothetical protein
MTWRRCAHFLAASFFLLLLAAIGVRGLCQWFARKAAKNRRPETGLAQYT